MSDETPPLTEPLPDVPARRRRLMVGHLSVPEVVVAVASPYIADIPVRNISFQGSGLIHRPKPGDANPEGKAAARRLRQMARDKDRQDARARREAAQREIFKEFALALENLAALSWLAADGTADMVETLRLAQDSLRALLRTLRDIEA